MNWTEHEVKKTIDIIMSKTVTDMNFRKKVLSDPELVIEEISGKSLPEGFKVNIIENEKGIDQTYVLHDFTGEELSDDQLDSVAGGRGAAHDHEKYKEARRIEREHHL